MLLTSLLKDFSAGCLILKGLKTIFNYNESFLVWLLGPHCGRAGRKGSEWWSWMFTQSLPTLVGCKESLGSSSGRAGEGEPSWLAQPPLCRFWFACVGAEPGGTAVSPRATAGWVCSPALGSDSTERHHFQLKHLDVFKTAFFKIIITNCRKAVA